MSAEWPRRKVIDLQECGILLVEDGNHGEYRPRRHEFTTSGTAFIRAADMNDGSVLFDTAERINDEALNRIRKGVGKPGDVLFSHKGTVGKLALVPLDAPPFVCSPQTTFWRCLDDSALDRRFLHCFMRSSEFQDQWFARKGETDMADYVSLTAQRQLVVAVPSIAEQRAISEIVGALDDKIELNQQMNVTVERIATALFVRWYSQQQSVDEDFPAATELVEAGVMVINDGYRAKRSELGSSGLPFVRAGNLHDDGVDLSGADILRDESVLRAGSKVSQPLDVAFTSKGTVGRMTLVSAESSQFVYSPQVCFWRATNTAMLSPHVLYHWMRSDEFFDQVDRVKGQTDMADYVSLTDQRRMRITLPLGERQNGIRDKLSLLHDRIAATSLESQTLSKTRNLLLPRLLSGEIRLRDAEKLIEEVA